MTDKPYKKLRIFIASPADVAPERARLHTVVENLNSGMADHLGVVLEIKEWGQAPPDMGRPQEVIFDYTSPDEWDLFMGVLWLRFGTESGGTDPEIGRSFQSGTEEEFHSAYKSWKETSKPRLMIYRCNRPPLNMRELDVAQYGRVEDFFRQFYQDKAHPGLYQSFDTPGQFERMARDHLEKWLRSYSEKALKKTIPPQMEEFLSPKTPDNLPRRQPFFGREEEMTRTLRALQPEDRGWGALIDGIRGIGKTALALEAAHRCREQGKFQSFIFITAKRDRLEPSGVREESYRQNSLHGMLDEAGRVLGHPGIGQLSEGPAKQQALLEALRGQNTLLIFDNLETLEPSDQEAVNDFLRRLPPDAKAIITSRRRGGEAALTIRLEKLPWEEARDIFEDQLRRHLDDLPNLRQAGVEGWRRLHDEAGGSPLAIIWTMGLMRQRGMSMDKALSMLRDGATESDLNAFIYREAQKTMTDNDRTTLQALSLFGGPATFEALSQTANLGRNAMESVLERLRALSMVDVLVSGLGAEAGEERYYLHPLTQRFARNELAKDKEQEEVVGLRFASFWLDFAKRYGGNDKDAYRTYPHLKKEWNNLHATCNLLGKMAQGAKNTSSGKKAGEMLVGLASALRNFLFLAGLWEECALLSERAYEMAVFLRDWDNTGWMAHNAAFIYGERLQMDEAALWVDRCAEAWDHQPNKRNQATVNQMRGRIASDRREYDRAEVLLLEALQINQDLGHDRGISIALDDLGDLAFECKDYQKSREYFRRALELVPKTADKLSEVRIKAKLSEVFIECREWPEARALLEEALPLAEEVGSVPPIAIIKYHLAQVKKGEGRPKQALPLAREALAVFQRLQFKKLAETKEFVEALEKEDGRQEGKASHKARRESVRFFNTAGPVDRRDHYQLDPLRRLDLEGVTRLIAQKKYFALHAPRQTGKTSCLLALRDYLNRDTHYHCLYINAEVGQAAREDAPRGIQAIMSELASRASDLDRASFLRDEAPKLLKKQGPDQALNELLKRWAQSSEKPVVLLIDEIDALVGDTLISVLRQLRAGYDKRPEQFPQSVVLCGVRDVKDYRMHSHREKMIITGGSAFNIKAESLRLGDFTRSQMEDLCGEHTLETGQKFQPEALEILWELTCGQPWLVNAMAYETCFKMEEGRDRKRPITQEMMIQAKERLIERRETHLDQLADKLKEKRVRSVIEPLLVGAQSPEGIPQDDLEYVRDLGLINASGTMSIANPIYREVIPRMLTYTTQLTIHQEAKWYVESENGMLDMKKLLEAFQQFFREHSEHWVERFDYKEAGPQLLMQAFLQRVVNGGGRVEREYGLGRMRTDLLLIWPCSQGTQKVVLELKLNHKGLEKTIGDGLKQTMEYMDRCDTEEGHLIIFDRTDKPWKEKIFQRSEGVEGKTVEVWGM